MSTPTAPATPAKTMKFTVSSADEAVNLIRRQMGPQAKVVSVRQVEGRGLAKFLSAPKLEVIATLGEEEKRPQPALPSFSAEEKALLEEKPADKTPAPAVQITQTKVELVNKLEQILRAAGFEASLIRRFQTSTDWDKLQRLPLKTALSDLARRLTLDFEAIRPPAPTQMIAFLGSSGVGKTTALCKQLAHEVFFERRSVQVLKLDGGTPNADTALGLYCEVMGVPLLRNKEEANPTSALLVDTAGVNLQDPDEIAALKKKLDEMGVKTRVWVVNAGYDNTLIDRGLAVAEELGVTHTVFTHLDEVTSTSRLWQFVLSGRMPALFGCQGPGVAHDRLDSIGPVLLQKTFPEYLLK